MPRTGDNIYKRKDGRWEGRYIDGTKADGKPKYHSIYGKSYDEVKAKMPEYTNRIIAGTIINITINKLSYIWLNSLKNSVKESTISNYKMKIDKHINVYFNNTMYDKITPDKVHEFVDFKLNSGLSQKYVSDIIVVLKSIFKYASREYKVYNPIANVHVSLKKSGRNDVALLSDEEQRKLYSYISKNKNRSTLGIAAALYTGIRIGELCGLKWEDVDLEKKLLTVKRTVQRIANTDGDSRTKLVITDPKSCSSKRVIPIPDCLLALLAEFKGQDDTFVLSGTDKPVEPRTMQNRFKSILKKVNLPSIRFHALRHMFATNCISQNCDVKTLSEILGHSSVEITLNKYVHSSLERKREFMNKLNFAA